MDRRLIAPSFTGHFFLLLKPGGTRVRITRTRILAVVISFHLLPLLLDIPQMMELFVAATRRFFPQAIHRKFLHNPHSDHQTTAREPKKQNIARDGMFYISYARTSLIYRAFSIARKPFSDPECAYYQTRSCSPGWLPLEYRSDRRGLR